MKIGTMNPVLRVLSSMPLAVFLMAAFAVAIAVATFVEVRYGAVGAQAVVYKARWFEAILALMVIALVARLIRRLPWRPKHAGFVIVHIAMIVILAAAGITRYWGFEGTMHIREGDASSTIFSMTDHIQLQDGDETADFPVRLYKPGRQSASGGLDLAGESWRVEVLRFWPHYELGFESGEGGEAMLDLMLRAGADGRDAVLTIAAPETFGDLQLRLRDVPLTELPPVDASAVIGELLARIDGRTHRIPLPDHVPAEAEAGGFTFRFTEWQADFKVGREADDPAAGMAGQLELHNPMVKVEITDPAGNSGERMLFALHPDFSMGHSGTDEEMADIDLVYDLSRGIDFAAGDDNSLYARATVPLQQIDMHSSEVTREITLGEDFEIVIEALYLDPASGLSLVVRDFLPSAVRTPVLSDDDHQPSAVELRLTAPDGSTDDVFVSKYGRGETIELGGRQVTAVFGPVRVDLPYSLHLDRFEMQTYPGSDNPAAFRSHLRLFDEELGIDGRDELIFMNNPLVHRGSRHYQSSYDTDRRGTILSVNHDPGTLPTYVGYFLISLGFIVSLIKRILKSKRRWATKKAGRAASVVLLAVLAGTFATEALAQHDHVAQTAVTRRFISDETRAELASLTVQDFRGRMKPLDTLAREASWKITKKGSFDGWHPVDLVLSWLAVPQYWWDQEVIAVRFPGLKQLMGVSQDARWVSPASLFDEHGNYRLAAAVEEAMRTPDRERSKTQRKLISFDERFNLLYMAMQGRSLRLFPLPDDPGNTWGDVEDVVAMEDPAYAARFKDVLQQLIDGVRLGDDGAVRSATAATAALQLEYGAEVLPSPSAMRLELLLNRTQPFMRVALVYLLACLVLLGGYVWCVARRDGEGYSWRHPLWATGQGLFLLAILIHLTAYVCRWIASARAPLSNGYESLLFIGLMVAVAGLSFEWRDRQGAASGLSALLTALVLGVAMLSTFDPAIGPLVPVLNSYWLNLHVTVITAGYGFLGLAAMIGMLVLVLFLFKKEGRTSLREAIDRLDDMNFLVLLAGLALLSIGTLLGGVWANEAWGRYWGWDAKETWSLATILIYAIVLHFRWVPALRGPWAKAAGSFLAITSVLMTYFGVNYFLSGLHSYASGDVAVVPTWAYIAGVVMLLLTAVSNFVARSRRWDESG